MTGNTDLFKRGPKRIGVELGMVAILCVIGFIALLGIAAGVFKYVYMKKALDGPVEEEEEQEAEPEAIQVTIVEV